MLCAASAAEAARVSWSVGVSVAPVATYVSNGPGWYPAPVRYARPRVGHAPAPVYSSPAVYVEPYAEPYAQTYADVYDVPSVRYAAPAPVYFRPPHFWLPPLPRLPYPRVSWDAHDRWHHDGGHRR